VNEQNNLEDQHIAWTPSPEVIERAQLTKFMRQVGVSTWDELYQFSIRDVGRFTEEVLKFLDIKFDPTYDKLLDTSNGIEFPTWFSRNADAPVRNEGRFGPKHFRPSPSAPPEQPAIADEGVRVPTAGLNITTMCLDRWQTDEMKNQPAVIWEGEEAVRSKPVKYSYTYGELFQEVGECAAGLRYWGFAKGDAIGIHMPMMIETVIALLAINRIGGIAVPVFSGYGVDAIASRLNAVEAKALFTCDGFPRRGKIYDAFSVADQAVRKCPNVTKVIIVDRSDVTPWHGSNPLADWYSELITPNVKYDDWNYAEPTSAEDPLIILYTSGTTGKPKGIAHTHASFPIKAAQDMAFGCDVGKGTRICWYTDLGWMMGPWLIYGALINGATICLYDGAPDYPTPDRMWEFCDRHKVEVLGISPTLVRGLAAAEVRSEDGTRTPSSATNAASAFEDSSSFGFIADEGVRVPPHQRHNLSSLRAFGSTGEPWNPGPWWWLFKAVGNSKLPIINYSGGTEISGGILMGNPLLPIKPCSFPAPCPGMDVDILDENGEPVGPNRVGELVIKQPWIGMARGFWQEKERYLETYWSRFKNIWVHGDWAMRDEDGHWFILGRSDDTLKVAGKRVGPAEVESILVSHPSVTEAAVIGVPDEQKGTAMVAFCVLGNADPLISERGRLQTERGRPRPHEGEARTTAETFANKRGWHDRGYIRHFDGVGIQFVTFRLADSLPQKVLQRLQKELESESLEDPSEEYRKRVEKYLDKGIGECILRIPEIAEIVEDTILNEDGASCVVFAWVIMPNHAHVLLQPLTGHSLSDIMQRIKSVSSHKINKMLQRKGAVWQPDYFDRYIRDGEHFTRTKQYIENNPVKAGLALSSEEWPFGSSSHRSVAASGDADEGVRVPLESELKALVARDMGKPLAPSKIHFVSALPKTRNAKVMRRVLRAAYLGEDPGDLSSLENPNTVTEIGELNQATDDQKN